MDQEHHLAWFWEVSCGRQAMCRRVVAGCLETRRSTHRVSKPARRRHQGTQVVQFKPQISYKLVAEPVVRLELNPSGRKQIQRCGRDEAAGLARHEALADN